ncbi:Na(+)-translocating NADH-quinone reductase subunit B [Thermaurantimonas aggregans]|uniref:Na(+)-translocating NADH-quinone reductase subunit B n=1 Tax=Thermaurantimonas aggregans TaxID=2173829 RepID=A0A401XNL9_9FLAO|nr:NADH:ubiquinone reductase (Na(+)-transporting) subunit B [Thermaurantimonas aggregans]MCX8148460.1 NADH:ubiquinone reductase (Na(+)-transporting) subunit B [Thermaurantimonas aggregans]GCD78595.1 Na(+)-translocating NADH-quinone reductase subunit B [Thermaurantimonas aggregans]
MKAIQNFMDSLRPQFEKGGKLHKYWPAYDAFYTFLFVPGHTTPARGAHIRDGIDLKRTMFTVIVALIPALLFGMYNAGYQHFKAAGMLEVVTFWDKFLYGATKIIPMLIVSYGVGLGIEFGMAIAKGHQINEGYLVTGMLIPLIMPIDIPLWMLALSVVFAVVIGKEVFGGTGMNILNPALTARVFAFFAYPSYMSGEKVWIGGMLKGEAVDGYSGATALGDLATTGKTDFSAIDMFLGFIPGSVGETSTLAILIGAVILIATGVGSWKIMLSGVLGALTMGLIFNAVSSAAITPEMKGFMSIPAWQHLIMGGFAFGIVFMATDPVSAAQTEKGKWIYGFLIGFFAIMIRVFNPAYPEGIMLAILLMNVFAPLIDHYVVEANIRKRMKRMKLQTVKA